MLKIKEFYSALELANLGLQVLPKTTKGIIGKAKKENWLSRPRTGKGGGLEYAFDGLPKAVQDEIRTKHLVAQVKGNAPAVRVSGSDKALIASERDVATLTDKDRTTADSRLLMALLVARYAVEQNLPRTRAIKLVSKLSRAGELPTLDGTDYNQICTQAVARKNTGTLGVGERALHEWVLNADNAGRGEETLQVFAPHKQGRPQIEVINVAWLADFMAAYRNTSGVCVAEAYRGFVQDYDGKKVAVYIDQHDPQSVIVKTLDGKYLCDAVLNGNKKDAFPLSLVERAKVGRTKARLARLDDEAQKAKLELRKTLQIEASESFGELGGFFALQETQKAPSESDDDDFVLFEHELKKFG